MKGGVEEGPMDSSLLRAQQPPLNADMSPLSCPQPKPPKQPPPPPSPPSPTPAPPPLLLMLMLQSNFFSGLLTIMQHTLHLQNVFFFKMEHSVNCESKV